MEAPQYQAFRRSFIVKYSSLSQAIYFKGSIQRKHLMGKGKWTIFLAAEQLSCFCATQHHHRTFVLNVLCKKVAAVQSFRLVISGGLAHQNKTAVAKS